MVWRRGKMFRQLAEWRQLTWSHRKKKLCSPYCTREIQDSETLENCGNKLPCCALSWSCFHSSIVRKRAAEHTDKLVRPTKKSTFVCVFGSLFGFYCVKSGRTRGGGLHIVCFHLFKLYELLFVTVLWGWKLFRRGALAIPIISYCGQLSIGAAPVPDYSYLCQVFEAQLLCNWSTLLGNT